MTHMLGIGTRQLPIQNPPAQLEKTDQAITVFQRAINAVSADLYQMMAKVRNPQQKNFCLFTPNLMATLGLLYSASPKQLRSEMDTHFHMDGLNDGAWLAHLGNWIKTAVKSDAVKLKMGQAVVVRSDTELTSKVANEMKNLDPSHIFFESAEGAKRLVNKWVEEGTEGKIKNLVESLPDEVVFLLVSASLFNGSWVTPFDPKNTFEKVFFNSSGGPVMVNKMEKDMDVNFCALVDEHVDICELPFEGGISMFFVKPEGSYYEPKGLAEIAENLKKFMTFPKLQDMLDNHDQYFKLKKKFNVQIPKVTFKDKTNLLDELKDEPFANSIAKTDFREMFTEVKQPVKVPTFISEVQLTVDEKGAAVAAAAYAVGMLECRASGFDLNGPFGFLMVDNSTKTIMCMGQVLNLEGKKAR